MNRIKYLMHYNRSLSVRLIAEELDKIENAIFT